MGSFSYGPKHYNPNWSLYSSKRKKWEATHKKKENLKSNNTKILQKKNQKKNS
jgi:hypothetical protein